MAGGSSASGAAGNAAGVRIVVAGDAKTGKSSLIVTAAAENFPTSIPPVLPPTRLPDDLYPDRVPVTIFDTSSSPEHRGKLVEQLTKADAVVLTYACDRPDTLDRLSSFWLPELRRLEVKVPVIVVGCMLDKRGDQQPVSLEQVMSPIMQQFREIETCIECSAVNHIQIPEVFYYAQKAVLHPTSPLFDQEQQVLKPRCVRALKRIFILCDHDRDGALSDAELNDFQVKCFNAPLQPSEIVGVKRVVREKLQEGVDERGLTLTGFLFLHALFIEKGRLETTWTVLRKFGYNNEIKLRDDQLPPPIKRYPDQVQEDLWTWTLEESKLYSVQTAYATLLEDSPIDGHISETYISIWKTLAPSKVAALIWRVIRDRLPTRSNLSKRNIFMGNEAGNCAMCSLTEETTNHLFFCCPESYSLWMKCYRWLGFYTVLSSDSITHHWNHHGLWTRKKGRKAWMTIWSSVLWTIWLHRNNLCFKGSNHKEDDLLETVIHRSWFWITNRGNNRFLYSFVDWRREPLICLLSS